MLDYLIYTILLVLAIAALTGFIVTKSPLFPKKPKFTPMELFVVLTIIYFVISAIFWAIILLLHFTGLVR